MKDYKAGGLSLLRGAELKLTDTVSVKNPTLNEIDELDYDIYSEYLSIMISNSLDVADVLWCEKQIWYEDIKNEWEFFLQKCMFPDGLVNVLILNDEGGVLKVLTNCIIADKSYCGALNFFLGLTGAYVIIEQTLDGTTQNVLYNVQIDEFGNYYVNSKSFKFTQFFYEATTEFLKKVNWIKSDYDFTNGGNKKAKKYILQNMYKGRKRKRNDSRITLDSVVSSLIAKGQNAELIWSYSIYLIYNLYYRLIKIEEYDNTMMALYNGCIDTKKHPINWDKINWSSVIS